MISVVVSTLHKFLKKWPLHSYVVSWKMFKGCAENKKIEMIRGPVKFIFNKVMHSDKLSVVLLLRLATSSSGLQKGCFHTHDGYILEG